MVSFVWRIWSTRRGFNLYKISTPVTDLTTEWWAGCSWACGTILIAKTCTSAKELFIWVTWKRKDSSKKTWYGNLTYLALPRPRPGSALMGERETGTKICVVTWPSTESELDKNKIFFAFHQQLAFGKATLLIPVDREKNWQMTLELMFLGQWTAAWCTIQLVARYRSLIKFVRCLACFRRCLSLAEYSNVSGLLSLEHSSPCVHNKHCAGMAPSAAVTLVRSKLNIRHTKLTLRE